VPRDLGDCAGQLDARRPAANNHDVSKVWRLAGSLSRSASSKARKMRPPQLERICKGTSNPAQRLHSVREY